MFWKRKDRQKEGEQGGKASKIYKSGRRILKSVLALGLVFSLGYSVFPIQSFINMEPIKDYVDPDFLKHTTEEQLEETLSKKPLDYELLVNSIYHFDDGLKNLIDEEEDLTIGFSWTDESNNDIDPVGGRYVSKNLPFSIWRAKKHLIISLPESIPQICEDGKCRDNKDLIKYLNGKKRLVGIHELRHAWQDSEGFLVLYDDKYSFSANILWEGDSFAYSAGFAFKKEERGGYSDLNPGKYYNAAAFVSTYAMAVAYDLSIHPQAFTDSHYQYAHIEIMKCLIDPDYVREAPWSWYDDSSVLKLSTALASFQWIKEYYKKRHVKKDQTDFILNKEESKEKLIDLIDWSYDPEKYKEIDDTNRPPFVQELVDMSLKMAEREG